MAAPRRILALLVVLPLLLAADPTSPYALLKMRRYRLAAQAFRSLQADHPGNPSVEVGLGRAWAGMGRCREAVIQLAPYRGTPAWNARASLVEGDCWQRLGDPTAALEAYRDAAAIHPEQPTAWLELGQLAVELHDGALFDEAIAGLGDDHPLADALGAWAALQLGQPDLDARLALLRRAVDPGVPAVGLYLHLIDGLAWLDRDDPAAAVAAFERAREAFPRHQRVTAWLAEAHRRLGEPEEALALLDATRLGGDDSELHQAIRARVRADLGDPDAADGIAALSASDADVLATRWYVASSGRDALAARWAERPHPPARTLEQLVPITEPR